jgi:hypothetical protein
MLLILKLHLYSSINKNLSSFGKITKMLIYLQILNKNSKSLCQQ